MEKEYDVTKMSRAEHRELTSLASTTASLCRQAFAAINDKRQKGMMLRLETDVTGPNDFDLDVYLVVPSREPGGPDNRIPAGTWHTTPRMAEWVADVLNNAVAACASAAPSPVGNGGHGESPTTPETTPGGTTD